MSGSWLHRRSMWPWPGLFFATICHITTSSATTITPAPLSFPPSQYWDGNDGSWSSFALRVGSPEQYVRVLISTAGQATWVILPEGCSPSDGSGCPKSRGTTFNPKSSSTWKDQSFYNLALETNLNYTGNGDYGFESVGLGLQNSSGPLLGSQVVAGLDTTEFWMGIFGLGPQPTNFTTFDDPHPSFLATLKSQKLIPSLSWAYTAGAQYRLKGVYGSVTLGGHDTSRYAPNNLSFAFAPDISRNLVLGVQSITLDGPNGAQTSLLPNGILSFVDSTVPYIWLPLESCQAFERALGLTYDNTTDLYLVNDSLHNNLVASNYNFTFQLGNSETGGPVIDIVLPYASFDLTANYPLVANSSKYFPIKRAANDTQYTLGRTFLQEAYLIADYERNNFSISQAVFQDGAQEKLIAIPSINGSTSTNTTGPMHVVGPGGIAGIIVGFLALSLVGLSVFAFFTHRWPFKPLPLPKDDAAVDEKAGIKVEMAGHSFGELPGSKVASEFPSPSNGSKTDLTSTHSEMEARHKIELPGHNHVPEMHGNRSSPLAKPPTELADSSIYQELPGDPVPPNYHNNFI